MAQEPDVRYYLVSVVESITACYPIAAESEDEARRRMLDLVESGGMPAPSEGVASKRRISASECRETTLHGCESAIPANLSEEDRAGLLLCGRAVEAGNDPADIARTAKFVLEKTGSGALKPCAHRRF